MKPANPAAKPGIDLFETDRAGNIVIRSVLDWATVPVTGHAVILKLDYAETEEDIKKGGKALQVALTPIQARELGKLLVEQADNAAPLRGTKKVGARRTAMWCRLRGLNPRPSVYKTLLGLLS